MNQGKWHSKRAVMKDLTRVTGINHFHENTFVTGERPPPSRTVEDLPEMYGYEGVMHNFSNEFEKPDLDGITQMLRMVDKYDKRPEVIDETNAEEKSEVDNIITISKLNPDVDEFYPSNNLVAEAALKNKLVDNPELLKDKLQCDDKCSIAQNTSMCIENSKTLPKDAVHVNNNVDLEQMKEKLKTKISITSNTSCFKAKRERNLAIATLLKLYSQAPSSVSTKNDVKTETVQSLTSDAPLKLMPPNYFEKSLSLAKTNEVNINEIPVERNTNDNLIMNNKSETITERSTQNSNDTVSINNSVKNVCQNKEDTKDYNGDNNSTEWSESIFKDSVAKVTKWFESNSNKAKHDSSLDNLKDCETDQPASFPIQPSSSIKSTQKKKSRPSQEGPGLYLGQVTFRKKEGPKPNSPSLSVSDKTARQTPSNGHYVPSDYAKELSKMYTERANARKDLTDAIWTNLEKKLKAKDEIIRQKRTEERKKKQDSSSNTGQAS